jgi:hypothetical protein
MLFAVFASLAGAAHAQAPAAMEPLDQAICRMIDGAARANGLPTGFLTRVIWRESSFRSGVISTAGAEGIAQFMPGTARERGLADPFDPEQAIPHAARFLADLRRQFGSLGNAAAAYNAGPARVAAWLRGEGDLPVVTQSYMRFVTGPDPPPAVDKPSANNLGDSPIRAAEQERGPEPSRAAPGCLTVLADLRRDADDDGVFAPTAPWGVQLAGNFSKARALASFERARQRYARVIGDMNPMVIGRLLRHRGTRRFYQVRLPAASRQIAEALCQRIQSVGGNCVAMRS